MPNNEESPLDYGDHVFNIDQLEAVQLYLDTEEDTAILIGSMTPSHWLIHLPLMAPHANIGHFHF